MRIDFNKYEGFIAKVIELPEHGVKTSGYFPYETARINNANVPVPREVFSHLENLLHSKGIINDNKIVVVFQVLDRFGEENFALQLKDNYARLGRWNEVINYHGEHFKLKEI